MCLKTQKCADAVDPFVSNGSVRGHKVLDSAAAVDALTKSASPEIFQQISALQLKEWDRVQVFNGVLRRHYEVDKHGKVLGFRKPRAQVVQQPSP